MSISRETQKRLLENTLKKLGINQQKTRGELPPPQKGKQEQFLNTKADIAIYGGAAGGGKTMGLLLDFAKREYRNNPNYNAVIFRRSYPEIKNPGGLLDESLKWYTTIQGKITQNPLDWQFPKGGKISFRHLQYEKTVHHFQGAQINRIGFDELVHFSDQQFFYLLSRNRSTSGIKSQVRATCNPDADSWVAKLIEWYIDIDGFPNPEKAGIIRYFIRLNDELIWANNEEDLTKYNVMPKSFTFIPASINDNQILLKLDPHYLANLQALHPVEQARLLQGNWKIRYEAGTIFDRTWFKIVETIPDSFDCLIRFWDLAATAQELATKNSFYTAGVKIGKKDNNYYVLDAIAVQKKPGEVENLILHTAHIDGENCLVRWELEGGSAGKLVAESLCDRLYPFDAEAIKPQGDKITRAKEPATQAVKGYVKLLRSPWNDQFLNAVQNFDGTPKPLTNDIVDAFNGAMLQAIIKEQNLWAQLYGLDN